MLIENWSYCMIHALASPVTMSDDFKSGERKSLSGCVDCGSGAGYSRATGDETVYIDR
jgi:hypothetical protein